CVFSLPRLCRTYLIASCWTPGWLALVGVWSWSRTGSARAGVVAGGIVALIPIAMMTAAVPQKLYLVPFLGLYALAAGRGIETLMGSRTPIRSPRVWITALAALAAVAIAPALRTGAIEGRQ